MSEFRRILDSNRQALLELSSVIENAPYMLGEGQKSYRIAGECNSNNSCSSRSQGPSGAVSAARRLSYVNGTSTAEYAK